LDDVKVLSAIVFLDFTPKSLDIFDDFWRDQWAEILCRLQAILVNKPLVTHALALEVAVTQAAAYLFRREMQALGSLCDAYVASCVDHVFSIPGRVYSVTA
jgi:hypothetical protein